MYRLSITLPPPQQLNRYIRNVFLIPPTSTNLLHERAFTCIIPIFLTSIIFRKDFSHSKNSVFPKVNIFNNNNKKTSPIHSQKHIQHNRFTSFPFEIDNIQLIHCTSGIIFNMPKNATFSTLKFLPKSPYSFPMINSTKQIRISVSIWNSKRSAHGIHLGNHFQHVKSVPVHSHFTSFKVIPYHSI